MNDIIRKAMDILKTANFPYAVCGGYGLDLHAGRELRPHGDFDIVIFKEDKQKVAKFFLDMDWTIYGRFMEEDRIITQHIFYKIDDISEDYWKDCVNIWAVKNSCLPKVLHKLDRLQGAAGDVYTYQTRKWLVEEEIEFIELEIDGRDCDDFVVQESPKITRSMDKAILYREDIPYLAPEIILFYKTDKHSWEHPGVKPKTEADFKEVMPLLSEESRSWLTEAVKAAHGEHEWIKGVL
ncbi:MAG: hypothetical protein FWB74_07805 [Defluviitaleaceae bacterium]|nr:hypothetical protein [Defluviitaleaceae bacterium]